jgi:ribose/xylose/arabinose/galactoside ABC-type transport system permease subunit
MAGARRTILTLTFLSCLLVSTAQSGLAYVDPGAGSYIFQVLVGVVLGAVVAIKVFWRRIWRFVTRRRPVRDELATGAPPITTDSDPRD